MEASRVATPALRTSLKRVRTPANGSADPAFELLYRRHAREVYQYALALVTNPSDAEDVTQTTFLNAYRALQRGERPHRPHNWLIAIAHNVCRMRWRQANSRPSEVALEDAPEPVAPSDEKPDLDQVLRALATLSFNQRAALVMRELEGRSYQEIAGVLDLSVSAVEALLFRARQRLRLHKSSLGVLTTVPLPGSLSLSSLLGAGGGGAAAGGAALGADVLLKAAAVVAAGALTAGVGYQSVRAVAQSNRPASAPAGLAQELSAAAAAQGPGAAQQRTARSRADRSAAAKPGTAGTQPTEPTANAPGSPAPALGSLRSAPGATGAAPLATVQNTATTASAPLTKLVAPVTQVAAPVTQLVAPVTQVLAPVTQVVAPVAAPVTQATSPVTKLLPPLPPTLPPTTQTVTTPTLPPPPIHK
jgi:RNA polymerase sigma-70 factor (ECF subfamily)